MTSVSWTSTASGNWNTGANWSGGNEPGATSDVTIAQSVPLTVTYSTGTDTILSLNTGYDDGLDVTGGTLAVTGQSDLGGTLQQSGGTLSFGGKTSTATKGIQQTGGTIRIASGALVLEGGSSSLGGTVTGGTLDLSYGTVSVMSGASLSVKQLELQGSTVTITGKLTESGLFEETSGTLSIGKTITLSGTAGLVGGVITGAGALDLTGSTEFAGISFDGSGVVTNTGNITQDGALNIDYSTGSATITNSSHGTWTILGNQTIVANTSTTNALVINHGLFEKTASTGTATIDPSFTSTGTIEIAVGTLTLQGDANSLSGSIGGAGTLEFFGTGTTTLAKSLDLTVGTLLMQNGAVDLAGSMSYAGTLVSSFGSLVLQSDTLTLTGTLEMSDGSIGGSGEVLISGGGSLSGRIDGSALVQNGGTLAIGGLVVGLNTGDSAVLQNSTDGTLLLGNGHSISSQSGDQFINNGMLQVTGTGSINADLMNTGVISIEAGELILAGASSTVGGDITGTGTLMLQYAYGPGTTIGSGATIEVASLVINGSVLAFAASETYNGDFTLDTGTLSLGATTLTLSGINSLQTGAITAASGGTLALVGATSILSQVYVEGAVVLHNTGTITSLSSWVLESGSAGTASLDNALGGSVVLSDDSIEAESGVSIVNAGTIAKSLGGSGIGSIGGSIINTGTISVSQGTLSFLGGVSGGGHIVAGAGTELNFGGGASGGTVSLGAYSDLAVNAEDSFGEKIAGFAAGETIELNDFQYIEASTSFSFDTATDKLTVSNGNGSVTLSFSGSYTSGSFVLFNDGGIVGISHS